MVFLVRGAIPKYINIPSSSSSSSSIIMRAETKTSKNSNHQKDDHDDDEEEEEQEEEQGDHVPGSIAFDTSRQPQSRRCRLHHPTTHHENDNDIPDFWYNASLPWAVDMDGTLIHQDVTILALQKSLSWRYPQYWWVGVAALVLYYTGVTFLRILAYRLLEYFVPISPANDRHEITIRTRLLQALHRHRNQGGVVVLATASHVQAGRRMADSLEQHVHDQFNNQSTTTTTTTTNWRKDSFYFDDVLGSQPPYLWNVAGPNKAHLLAARFPKGFLYVGDSTDDLAVWSHDACVAMVIIQNSSNDKDVVQAARKLEKPYFVWKEDPPIEKDAGNDKNNPQHSKNE